MPTAKEKGEKVKRTTNEMLFLKQDILASKKYADQIDVLTALIEEERTYSLKEVDEVIKKYMKGRVK